MWVAKEKRTVCQLKNLIYSKVKIYTGFSVFLRIMNGICPHPYSVP